jgi:hypothetical protein
MIDIEDVLVSVILTLLKILIGKIFFIMLLRNWLVGMVLKKLSYNDERIIDG